MLLAYAGRLPSAIRCCKPEYRLTGIWMGAFFNPDRCQEDFVQL